MPTLHPVFSVERILSKERENFLQDPYLKLLKKNEAFLTGVGNNPMLDAVIDEAKKRQIRIGNKWFTDYASCNYLGLDWDEEVMNSIPEQVAKWGTHPSWSRMLGSPRIYEELEEQLADLLETEAVLILPNLSMTNLECIYILSAGGDIFLDKHSHRTLYEGAARARGMGAQLISFESHQLETLEDALIKSTSPHKLICVDGVYSMHGQYPNLPRIIELARQYGALIYLDDAHGFGIIGERSSDELTPYGSRGNGIVRYFNESYDNIVYLSCLSKSFSSYSAFLSCTPEIKRFLKAMVTSYLYSGPAPVATLATALKGLEVNRKRGDIIRADLYAKCERLQNTIQELEFRNENNTNFPIFNIYLEEEANFEAVTEFLYENGIYVTLCPYPMVQRADVGFRIQMTAANTFEEIDHLIEVLKELNAKFPVQKTQRVREPSHV